MSFRTHKIALKPNNKQRNWFAQQCGYARFAYNHALADFKASLDNDDFRSVFSLNKRFNQTKKEYDWTPAQDQRAAFYSIYANLASAIKNWVEKRANFPKFKKRGKHDSYTTDEQSVIVRGKRIRLPKIGWIRMSQVLRWTGKIIKVTISRTAHRWFVSITVDAENIKAVEQSTYPVPIGIDVGINTLATCSDGTKYDNPRPLKRFERKLAKAQRKLSRKKKGSNNWDKQVAVVARIHYRIACIRNDAHHKATTAIVKSASAIGIETLRVTNLLKNKNLAKALSDSALGGFLAMLKTKAEARGIPITEADQFFASSKTCSNCGHKKADLTLSDRIYQCDDCGFTLDRDLNAAINLRPELASGHGESLNACGAQVRPHSEARAAESGKTVWHCHFKS